MFQKVDEFHQVPTHVDDLTINIRLTKHVRDAQRRGERVSLSRRAGRVRLDSVEVLDTPEFVANVSYAIYDQDGIEMARGNVKAEDALTEQEIAYLEKAIRRVFSQAEKEILENEGN